MVSNLKKVKTVGVIGESPVLVAGGAAGLTLTVFVERVVEEAGDPVRGNGKGDSRCDLQGVDPNHLPVLKHSELGLAKTQHPHSHRRGVT